MEWQLPETITFGFVMFSVVMLLYRWLGQQMGLQKQTNELLAQSMNGYTGLEKSIDALKDAALAQTQELLSTRTAAAIRDEAIVAALVALKDSNTTQHTFAMGAIQAIPSVIEPAIKELTAQHTANTESNKGMQRIMEGVAKSQSKTNGEVLDAMQKVQASQERIEKIFKQLLDSNRRNETLMMQLIEKPQQDIAVLTGDLPKQNPEFIAPIESPKPETESEEKSDV